MVKAYSDLMIPLWEHLWTEKADFRKSELFRTNEEMRRMTEKESEKLIDIANREDLALINALPLFHALGHPLLLGASRKRMIGALSNEAPVEQRQRGLAILGWVALVVLVLGLVFLLVSGG